VTENDTLAAGMSVAVLVDMMGEEDEKNRQSDPEGPGRTPDSAEGGRKSIEPKQEKQQEK
jgi:hypothetical protein